MAADCTVIDADHPNSAANKVIGEAGFLVDLIVGAIANTLARALDGNRPLIDPVEQAQRSGWTGGRRRSPSLLTRYRKYVVND